MHGRTLGRRASLVGAALAVGRGGLIDGSPRAERLLDTGRIDLRSIRVCGKTVSYTSDGQGKTVTLP